MGHLQSLWHKRKWRVCGWGLTNPEHHFPNPGPRNHILQEHLGNTTIVTIPSQLRRVWEEAMFCDETEHGGMFAYKARRLHKEGWRKWKGRNRLKDTQRSMAVSLMWTVVNSKLVTCRSTGLTFLWIAYWYWLQFLRIRVLMRLKDWSICLLIGYNFTIPPSPHPPMPVRWTLHSRKGQLASQLLNLGMEFQQLAEVKKVKSSYSGLERPAVALEILIWVGFFP